MLSPVAAFYRIPVGGELLEVYQYLVSLHSAVSLVGCED